jgi:hypothetical protein
MSNDLHAAIAAYLRKHNPRILTPCPPPVPLLTAPRCARCRQEITAVGEQFAVAILVAARRCFDCFTVEAA